MTPAPEDRLHYLDNAATSYPKPHEIIQDMASYYEKLGVNPGRSGYDLAVEGGMMLERGRRRMTQFFGGTDPDRLIFAYNATDALNIAVNGLLGDGRHAVSTTLEHNSVLRPLWHAQEDRGCAVDYIRFDGAGFLDPDDIAKAIRPETDLVAVNHGSNVIGTMQDVETIGAICEEKGVPLLVDVSQTAGVVPLDVEKMKISVLAFTGHKSLLGPTGIGGLYVREGVEIAHTRYGGTGVRSAVRRHLDEFPYRLEAGTVNVMGVAGLVAGQHWIAMRGIDCIFHHEMALCARFVEGVKDLPNVTLYCCESLEGHIPVVSLNIEGYDAGDVGTILDVDYNVATRTGLHCAPLVHETIGTIDLHGSVRFSFGPLNTEEDVDAGIAGVRELAVERRPKG
jgi:cysteine desulfurase/selenocysteine lyase